MTGWSAEELAIIRKTEGFPSVLSVNESREMEPVPDRLPAKPGQPSIENPEVYHEPLRKQWQPKPEPLEGPASLSYERIVRLEWECGLRSGTINDWYRDVGQAQATDLERRREVVRRDDNAGERRVGRVGSGRAGGWWIRSTSTDN